MIIKGVFCWVKGTWWKSKDSKKRREIFGAKIRQTLVEAIRGKGDLAGGDVNTVFKVNLEAYPLGERVCLSNRLFLLFYTRKN